MILKDSNNILDILPSINIEYNTSDIPVVENVRLNTNIIKFKDLDLISENTGLNYDDIIRKVKKDNNIENVSISMNEEEIANNPKVLLLKEDIYITPVLSISENYRIIDQAMTECIYNHDNTLLKQLLLEDENGDNDTAPWSIGNLVNKAKEYVSDFAEKHEDLKKIKDKVSEFAKSVKDTGVVQSADNLAKAALGKDYKEQVANSNPLTFLDTIKGLMDKGKQSLEDAKNKFTGQQADKGWWSTNLAGVKQWLNKHFGTKFGINDAVDIVSYLLTNEDYNKNISITEVYRPRRRYRNRYI